MTQDLQKEMNDEHLDREGFTEEMIPILKAYRGNRMTVEYEAYEIAKLAERHVYKPIETPHTPAKESCGHYWVTPEMSYTRCMNCGLPHPGPQTPLLPEDAG